MSTKRIVVTDRPIIKRELQPKISGVDTLITDALGTIELELVKFRAKVNSGKSLELAEGRLLTHYVKALIELSRESREREKTTDLSKLSDEELTELAKQFIKSSEKTDEK